MERNVHVLQDKKSDMKRHWQATHLKKKHEKNKNKKHKMDYLSESDESEYQSSSSSSFETESVANDNYDNYIMEDEYKEKKSIKECEYSDGLSENEDISSSSYYSSTTSSDA
eukprot:730814_1